MIFIIEYYMIRDRLYKLRSIFAPDTSINRKLYIRSNLARFVAKMTLIGTVERAEDVNVDYDNHYSSN